MYGEGWVWVHAEVEGHLYDLHIRYAPYCHRTTWMWYRGAKNEGAQRSRLRAGFKWSSKVMDCRFDQLSKKKGKVHPCAGTEALYRPYSP